MKRLPLALLVVSLLAPVLPGADKNFTLEGTVLARQRPLDHLQIQIVNPGNGMALATGLVRFDGDFELRDLPAGNYEARLVDQRREVLASRPVSIPSYSSVDFKLEEVGLDRAGGAVSSYRLSHKVPNRARKSFEKSEKEFKAGRSEQALALLDAALAQDPEYADALHTRGLFHLKAKEYDAAIKDLDHASRLDDVNPRFLADSAVAHYAAGQADVAERNARQALRFDPNSAKAHYLLALALIGQGKKTAETRYSLEQAAPAYPGAGAMLMRFSASR